MPVEKRYTDEQDCYPIYNHVISKMALKVNPFAGFCHHRLVTTSAHMNAYCYSLFKSGMKTGL